MTTADKHEAINKLIDKIAEHLADSLNDSSNWMDYREHAATCLEAIANFGGVVCSKEPAGWKWSFDGGEAWYFGQNKPGDFRFGNPDIVVPLHAPLSIAGKGDDGWMSIERADKSADRIYDLPGMPRPIANSEEYWCRDADGRVFLATWADDGKRAYWWDLEGESPVDPVEFMPHPLDQRFAAPPSIPSNGESGK